MRPADNSYRPDIDGLRALAVLAVLAYHAAPARLPGGFVGVDVFFVISGFLITRIIVKGMESGAFSLWTFYARRARRIFPALIVVLLVTLGIGWVLLLPEEWERLGAHVVAGAFFSSNLLLFSESGYFDNESRFKPLLHLWSLGVEEQFYLIWPLLLLCIWKLPRYRMALGALLALASFVSCLYATQANPTAAFYLPFNRFWELWVGALLGIFKLRHEVTSVGFRLNETTAADTLAKSIVSMLGLGLIVGSMIVLSNTDPFPGWRALLPVTGTALVIAAGQRAWVNKKLLSNRVVVYIGLISYPLYLWHWPLMSYIDIYEPEKPELRRLLLGLALFIAFIAAMLTYHFLERPLQRKTLKWAAVRTTFAVGLVAIVGGVVFVANGFPSRLQGLANSAPSSEFVWSFWTNRTCLEKYPFEERQGWFFCMQNKEGEASVILLGDSHSNHLYPGLATHPELKHQTILSIGTCPPDPGIRYLPKATHPANPCVGERKARQEKFIEEVLTATPTIRFALLSAAWPSFDERGHEIDYSTGGSDQRFVTSFVPDEVELPIRQYINAISRQIADLEKREIQVVVSLNSPRLPYNVRACFDRPFRTAKHSCEVSMKLHLERTRTFRREFSLMIAAKHPATLLFDPAPALCDSSACRLVKHGKPMLRDSNHLSLEGSKLLSHSIVNWSRDALPGLLLP